MVFLPLPVKEWGDLVRCRTHLPRILCPGKLESASGAVVLFFETQGRREIIMTNVASHGMSAEELARRRANGAILQIDEPYPILPQARYGFGRPCHQRIFEILAQHDTDYDRVLQAIAGHIHAFERVAMHASPDAPLAPHWDNIWLPALDGMSLYAFVADRKPRRYIEIGSGISTRFVAQATLDHGLATQIISIDPHPRSEIDTLCHQVLRSPLEELDLAFFDTVSDQDIVYMDGSHRALQNTDATVFFLEIIPRLPVGCLFGIHDILLPDDYPPEWLHRYYNEQYLLACLILFGSDAFRFILPSYYVSAVTKNLDALAPLRESPKLEGVGLFGSIFWMEKNSVQSKN